jgi:large subunit ribosomal protein L29
MKNKELKGMSKEELGSKMIELRKELMKENAQIKSGTTPKSPGRVRNSKKTIARILTLLKTKEVTNKDE